MKGLVDTVWRLSAPTRPGAFRLWLALLVFVHHLSSLGLGPFAVYIFFAISGFWIQTMWDQRYRGASQPYRTYLTSRFWRLAPMMIVINAITIIFLLGIGFSDRELLGEPVHLLISSVFLLGYAWLDYLPVGAAWSLDVEAQFYCIVPLLAALLRRMEPKAFLLLAAAANLAFNAFLDIPPTLLQHVVYFAIGMAAARGDWRPSKRMAGTSAGLVIAICLALTLSPLHGMLWGGAEPGPLYVYNPSLNAGLALLAMPYALWTVRQPDDQRDLMFGDLSYIVYLQHWAAMQWFATLDGTFWQRLPAAALCFVVVLPMSFALWRWIDRPLQQRRAAWVKSRVTTPAVRANGRVFT